MAKKKDGRVKLPKHLAGVKIPKTVRNGPVGEFLRSKAGQALIAEAVMAGVALVTAKEAKPGSASRKGKTGLKSAIDGDSGLGAIAAAPATLAFAFSEAGRAFADALRGRQPQADAGAESPDDDWPLEAAPVAGDPKAAH